MDRFAFDLPAAWQFGLPLVGLLLVLGAWSLRRRGLAVSRVGTLLLLRGGALTVLVLLVAQPMWIEPTPPGNASRAVVVLVDRSESMSLEEDGHTRFHQALEFLRARIVPALGDAGMAVQVMTFAEDARLVDASTLRTTVPDGRRTGLAAAVSEAIATSADPPLAVIALTDGLANESAGNARALAALVESRVPFVGIGFGSETGARTVSLRRLDAPLQTSTNTTFRITAEMETTTGEEIPPFELVLLRDGRMLQTKTVRPGSGSRLWRESFSVSEAEEGLFQYQVHFVPPPVPGLKSASTVAAASVRVTSEKELRVLYVQGALTWDYKFASRACRGDPTIRLTGSTRTSQQSVFRQNVESSEELSHGFPGTLAELAPFRVVVLAELTPADLTPDHQELLARFCAELGGGVLLIGGAATFNSGWKGSRLEQVLPVAFAAHPGIVGLDRPFRLRLTPEALGHPLFQIAGDGRNAEAWAAIPPFQQYGRLDGAKPGAQVWAEHPDDDGPQGRRVLVASQRYGAGISAVVSVQNLWRWRLARDSDPLHFDRFWRQLLRHLSEPSLHEIRIDIADQDLRPRSDIRLSVERQPRPGDTPGVRQTFRLVVTDDRQRRISEQDLELFPGRPAEVVFRAETPGLYSVRVLDASQRDVAFRPVEVRDANLEFIETARNMEALRQWASLSGGLAVEAERAPEGRAVVGQIREKVEVLRRFKPLRRPAGMNGGVLALVLGCLVIEWILRKRWLFV